MASGQVLARIESGVGVYGEAWRAVAECYYSAYGEYIRAVSGKGSGSAGVRRGGTVAVVADVSGVAPPLWMGCCNGVCKELSSVSCGGGGYVDVTTGTGMLHNSGRPQWCDGRESICKGPCTSEVGSSDGDVDNCCVEEHDALPACVPLVRSGSGVVVGPNGGVSKGRGPNYEKNQLRRLAKKSIKRGVKLGESCNAVEVDSTGGDTGKSGLSASEKLKRSFDERRIAENELATQRARYNIRRNDYLQKARVSEQNWETERLTSDEKLRKISEARLGASPGFAKTIVEEGLASPSAPSLSDGTVSPNSSISVEEVQKMNRTIEKQAAANVELQKKLDKFVEMFGDEGETADDIIYPEQKKGSGMPREQTHKVMWGECVPLKGRYKFQADHYQNGNLVIAIDGEIVEVDWRGEPFEYCGRDVLYVTPSMDGHIDE